MATSVRFCLSYDPLKWDFIAFQMNIILIGNHIADTVIHTWLTMFTTNCY